MGCVSTKNLEATWEETVDVEARKHLASSLKKPEPCILDPNDYKILKFIQQGGMGKVYSARHRTSGEIVACKFFGYTQKRPSDASIQYEIDIMLALDGIDGVVGMKGIFMDSPEGYIDNKRHCGQYPVIVMDYLSGGDLFDRIHYKSTVSEKDLAKIFRQVITALDSVHSRRFIHRDLKLENIMMVSKSDDSSVKLIDFGMMMKLEEGANTGTCDTIFGTAGYIAPETLQRRQYSFESDIWQAGCCLYSLLSGYFPFHPEYPKQIVSGNYFPMTGEGWDSISDTAKDLVRRILVPIPEQRPTTGAILSHPWLVDEVPNKDLGVDYFTRIKNLALRQKLKKFFIENDIEARHKERREHLSQLVPYLGRPRGTSLRRGDVDPSVPLTEQEREDEEFGDKIKTFHGRVVKSLASSTSGEVAGDEYLIPRGKIDFETFTKVLNEAGLSELASERVFAIFDMDSSGGVDLKEFLITMLAFRPIENEESEAVVTDASSKSDNDTLETIRLYFNVFDINQTGYIDLEELKLAVGCLLLDESNPLYAQPPAMVHRQASAVHPASLSNVEDLFAVMDVSKDGRVDFDEFKSFYTAVMAASTSRNFQFSSVSSNSTIDSAKLKQGSSYYVSSDSHSVIPGSDSSAVFPDLKDSDSRAALDVDDSSGSVKYSLASTASTNSPLEEKSDIPGIVQVLPAISEGIQLEGEMSGESTTPPRESSDDILRTDNDEDKLDSGTTVKSTNVDSDVESKLSTFPAVDEQLSENDADRLVVSPPDATTASTHSPGDKETSNSIAAKDKLEPANTNISSGLASRIAVLDTSKIGLPGVPPKSSKTDDSGDKVSTGQPSTAEHRSQGNLLSTHQSPSFKKNVSSGLASRMASLDPNKIILPGMVPPPHLGKSTSAVSKLATMKSDGDSAGGAIRNVTLNRVTLDCSKKRHKKRVKNIKDADFCTESVVDAI